jgi:pilus assembly protein Flp/PilA
MLTKPAVQALVFVQSLVARMRDEERGATAVEYGLMVAAIAAVIVTAVFILGGKVSDAFDTINSNWHP